MYPLLILAVCLGLTGRNGEQGPSNPEKVPQHGYVTPGTCTGRRLRYIQLFFFGHSSIKGINCSFSVLSLTCSNTLFHSVIFTSFPVAKAATGSSISQSSSCSRHSSVFLCLVSVFVASFKAVCRFSNFHRNLEKTWASCPASWLGFEHQKCFL